MHTMLCGERGWEQQGKGTVSSQAASISEQNQKKLELV